MRLSSRSSPSSTDAPSSCTRFCLASEKYNLWSTVQRALSKYGTHHLARHAPEVLGLALLYGLPALAAVALLEFDNLNDRDTNVRPEKRDDRTCQWRVRDIPWRLAKRLPFAVLVQLIRCETAIRRQDYRCLRWLDVLVEMQRVRFFLLPFLFAWRKRVG